MLKKKVWMILVSLLLAVALFAVPATAADKTVTNVSDLRSALNSAQPGDVVIYNGNLILINVNNFSGITVMAGVVLKIDGNLNVTLSRFTNYGTVIVTGNAGLNGGMTINQGSFYVVGDARSTFGNFNGNACIPVASPCTHPVELGAVTTVPTCTEQGYTSVTCLLCDRVAQGNYLPAIGHNWFGWYVTIPATATTEGEETRICMNDVNHKETRTIPATGAADTTTVTYLPGSAAGVSGTLVGNNNVITVEVGKEYVLRNPYELGVLEPDLSGVEDGMLRLHFRGWYFTPTGGMASQFLQPGESIDITGPVVLYARYCIVA
jgi:hypothetical protein